MFERGHSKHLSENKVTYRAGYSKNRAGGAGPPAPPESVLYNEASPFYGREFSDTLLQGCTQKQGLLKCAVSFPAVLAYLNSLPLRSVPWRGLTVLSTGCEISISHGWDSAAFENQEGGGCMGTSQKWESVLERWQSWVDSEALGTSFQITICDLCMHSCGPGTGMTPKVKTSAPKTSRSMSSSGQLQSELSVPSIFKLYWH